WRLVHEPHRDDSAVTGPSFQLPHRRIPRRGLDFPLLDQPIELFLDLTDARLREVDRGVDQDHVDPGLSGNLCDPLPHLPGAHHAELFDFGHRRSTRSAMPSPPPMHSDAQPVLAFRAAMGWSSVTSTRAPDAPIG